MQKWKVAFLLGTGLMVAASYLNAAHTSHFSHQKKAVEILANVETGRAALVSSDDWGSPHAGVKEVQR